MQPEVKAVGARVSYLRDAALREWFVNDSRGLEHGFTLEQAPDRAGVKRETEIEFDLAVRGDLRPAIASGRCGAPFRRRAGRNRAHLFRVEGMGRGWQESAGPFLRWRAAVFA